MKSTFTLNSFVYRMLDTAQYDTDKLVNAVQASLNSAVQTKEESTRGGVKLVGLIVDGERIKGGSFKFNESTSATFEGRTDAPARFARWHDATARLFKVCGEPSGELTPSILPASLKVWLDDKFLLTPAVCADAGGLIAAVKGNGKGKRNGNVEAVPAPTVPA
jgi:hypothetical protein